MDMDAGRIASGEATSDEIGWEIFHWRSIWRAAEQIHVRSMGIAQCFDAVKSLSGDLSAVLTVFDMRVVAKGFPYFFVNLCQPPVGNRVNWLTKLIP